eukprot:354579-Chlamydomonas_euryale.AAC.2
MRTCLCACHVLWRCLAVHRLTAAAITGVSAVRCLAVHRLTAATITGVSAARCLAVHRSAAITGMYAAPSAAPRRLCLTVLGYVGRRT